MDIFTYFEQKEREARELSLVPGGDFAQMCAAEVGDMRGRIFGRFWLTDNAYIAVNEGVVVRDKHIHREDYAYFLVIDGEEEWGEERDPSHDPAVHKHTGVDHARSDSEPISFRAFVERAWHMVYERTPQDA